MLALTRGEYEALRCTDEIGNYILKRLNDGKNPKYDRAVYNYVSKQVWTVVRTVLDETNAYVICQHYHEGKSLRSIAYTISEYWLKDSKRNDNNPKSILNTSNV